MRSLSFARWPCLQGQNRTRHEDNCRSVPFHSYRCRSHRDKAARFRVEVIGLRRDCRAELVRQHVSLVDQYREFVILGRMRLHPVERLSAVRVNADEVYTLRLVVCRKLTDPRVVSLDDRTLCRKKNHNRSVLPFTSFSDRIVPPYREARNCRVRCDGEITGVTRHRVDDESRQGQSCNKNRSAFRNMMNTPLFLRMDLYFSTGEKHLDLYGPSPVRANPNAFRLFWHRLVRPT